MTVQRMSQQTSDDAKAVDEANAPELVNHLEWYSKQQLKYQVWYDVSKSVTSNII